MAFLVVLYVFASSDGADGELECHSLFSVVCICVDCVMVIVVVVELIVCFGVDDDCCLGLVDSGVGEELFVLNLFVILCVAASVDVLE